VALREFTGPEQTTALCADPYETWPSNSNFDSNSDPSSEDRRPNPPYAVPKPTMDEILAAVARHNKTSPDFLKTDIETALTFAGIARTADSAKDRERNRRAARNAYDTVVRLIERVELTDHDKDAGQKSCTLEIRSVPAGRGVLAA
jgi:hypothetical protein